MNPAIPAEIASRTRDVSEFLTRDTLAASEKRLAFLLRPISLMLGIAFLSQAIWLALRPEASPLPYKYALVSALFFFALRGTLQVTALPAHAAHFIATVASLVANGYALADLRLSGSPWSTAQLLIVMLVAGFVFVSREWFTALVIVSCTGWFWAAFSYLSDDAWVQMGGVLLLTVIWSLWFLEIRLRSLAQFEGKVAQQEYKDALEQTQFFTKASKGRETWCPVCKASPDAVIRHDGSKIIDTNLAAATMLGRTCSEMEGMPLANILAPEKRESASAMLGNFEPAQTVAFRKDNSRVTVDSVNGPIGKEPGMMAMLLRDASLRDLGKERVTSANQRAQEFIRRQSDLAELASLVDKPGNRKQILERVASAAQRALNPSIGIFLALWDDDSKTASTGAASVPARLESDKLNWKQLKTLEKALTASKIGEDLLNLRASFSSRTVESFSAAPLIGSEGFVGILLALESNSRDFAPSDVEFLTILAHRATAAL